MEDSHLTSLKMEDWQNGHLQMVSPKISHLWSFAVLWKPTWNLLHVFYDQSLSLPFDEVWNKKRWISHRNKLCKIGKKLVRIIPDPHLRFGFAHEIDLCCCCYSSALQHFRSANKICCFARGFFSTVNWL